jgi:hypothetical protein
MSRRAIAFALLVAVVVTALVRDRDGGPPRDRIVDAVPADARLYLHVDRDTAGWDDVRGALRRLPALEGRFRALLGDLAPAAGGGDGERGIVLLAGRRGPLVLSVREAQRLVGRPGLAGGGGGGPAGRSERADGLGSLAGLPRYAELLRGLPQDRFAHLYASASATRGLRPVDPSLRELAAAASASGGRVHVRLRARHARPPGECGHDRRGGELLDLADDGAALYLELPSVACAIRALARNSVGARRVLDRLAGAAGRRSGVSVERELMPLLDRRGALIATPGERGGAPAFTLVVDGVDEERALDLLARMQPALIALLGTQDLGQAPSFGATEVEGVTAATARLAPGLELSYAAWDGRLAVSTSLDGIAAARGDGGLAASDRFGGVLSDRPPDPSALLFLDLDQLLALGEQAGLAADERYLAIRDDLQKLRAAGAVLTREREFTTMELTFQIP